MCTRNRQGNMLSAVCSVLACDYEDFELLVLDQSEDRSTEEALMPLGERDQRLRYFHLDFVGKPCALNYGLERAQGEYILLTDDDCEPHSSWIKTMVSGLRDDPGLGCLFGDVSAVKHDPAQGYIPVCRITRPARITRLSELVPVPPRGLYGMGANMGFCRALLKDLGGWDPCIGPGSRFGSGDDIDMSVRILRAGYAIGFSPDSRVFHYGMRKWSNGWDDQSRIGSGFGTIFAKHLRSGAIFKGSLEAMASASGKVLGRVLRRERHIGMAFPVGWLRGVGRGLRHPLDHDSGNFVFGKAASSERDVQFARIEFGMDSSRFGSRPT
jgi:glycosyltransferase involved in cell wall biosynthesis